MFQKLFTWLIVTVGVAAHLPAQVSRPITDGGEYTIQQQSSGRFLDAYQTDGEDHAVVTRENQGNDTQIWILKKTPSASYEHYYVVQKSSDRYLDAYQSDRDGRDYGAVTRDAQGDSTQIWFLRPHLGARRIEQASGFRVLDAYQSDRDGRDYRAVTRDLQHDETQHWLVKPTKAQEAYDTIQFAYAGAYQSGDCPHILRTIDKLEDFLTNSEKVPDAFQYTVAYPAAITDPAIGDLACDRILRLKESRYFCFD